VSHALSDQHRRLTVLEAVEQVRHRGGGGCRVGLGSKEGGGYVGPRRGAVGWDEKAEEMLAKQREGGVHGTDLPDLGVSWRSDRGRDIYQIRRPCIEDKRHSFIRTPHPHALPHARSVDSVEVSAAFLTHRMIQILDNLYSCTLVTPVLPLPERM
jgi:hypothetical protein